MSVQDAGQDVLIVPTPVDLVVEVPVSGEVPMSDTKAVHVSIPVELVKHDVPDDMCLCLTHWTLAKPRTPNQS